MLSTQLCEAAGNAGICATAGERNANGLLHITAGPLQGLQPLEDRVLPPIGACRFRHAQRLRARNSVTLHFHVNLCVFIGGVQAGMSEPVADGAEIHS